MFAKQGCRKTSWEQAGHLARRERRQNLTGGYESGVYRLALTIVGLKLGKRAIRPFAHRIVVKASA
jgi:hypothetical protein